MAIKEFTYVEPASYFTPSMLEAARKFDEEQEAKKRAAQAAERAAEEGEHQEKEPE